MDFTVFEKNIFINTLCKVIKGTQCNQTPHFCCCGSLGFVWELEEKEGKSFGEGEQGW